MKKIKFQKLAATIFALCLVATTASIAEQPKAPGEDKVNEITTRSAPSEENNINVLSPFAGVWSYSATVFTDADREPQSGTGKTTNEMVLGSRFLSSTSSGVLNIEGHEAMVNGQGMIGYDNAQKFFTSVWTDTLGTGMVIGTGKYDEKQKTITETGRFTNPINGEEEKFRAELRLDGDSYTRTIYTTGKSGKEAKLMEFKYTKLGLGKVE